jgi:hypothetical protein
MYNGGEYLYPVSALPQASRLFNGDTFPSSRIEESHVNDVNVQTSDKLDALTELLSTLSTVMTRSLAAAFVILEEVVSEYSAVVGA